MNPLSLFFAKYKALVIGIALVAAVIGLLWTGHHYGAQGVLAEWDREKAVLKDAENRAILARIKENERKAEQDKLNSARIAKEHKNAMDKVRGDIAAERLRVGPTWCGRPAEGTDPGSPGSGDGANPGTRLLPEALEAAIKSLIEETERAAATGRAAQEFIKSNGFAPE